MGQAKRRGTFEERRDAAIKAKGNWKVATLLLSPLRYRPERRSLRHNGYEFDLGPTFKTETEAKAWVEKQ